jgi:hypothetical protein
MPTFAALAGFISVPVATGTRSTLDGLSTVQRWGRFFWGAALTQKLMAMAGREPTSEARRVAPRHLVPRRPLLCPPSWGRFFV